MHKPEVAVSVVICHCWPVIQGIEEAGTRLAQVLTKKESIAKMKASMPAEVAKSLARVSGGLYVITAANKTARGAMLASWVAQASFEPLGLTVAVAKDRAIESLMQVNSCTMVAPNSTAGCTLFALCSSKLC